MWLGQGQAQGTDGKGNENCRKWGHKDASEWHERKKKRNRLTEFEAARRLQFSVDFVTSVHVCPKSYATYATLSLKVWSMREVVYNEMNLHGEVFTVKVFAVV